MKLKVILAALVAAAFTGLQAQSADTNWFMQGNLGASYAPSEASFGQSISPAGQVSVGKFFTPLLGARLAVGGWQGRAGLGDGKGVTDFTYWSATVDGLLSLHNAFWGEKEDRKFNTNFLLGVGFNDRVGIGHRPSGSFMVKTGFNFNYRVSPITDVNLEVNANGVSDRWNKLDDHSFDTYFNVMVGMTFRLGTGYKCKYCRPVEVINDEYCDEGCGVQEIVRDTVIVEVHDTIEVVAEPAIEDLPSAAVFFSLAKSDISAEEDATIRQLIKDVNGRAVYYVVTGYADKGTGNPKINEGYSKARAERVAAALNEKYGVAKDDIKVDWKGDTVQPYAENNKNRVAIIAVEKK